MIPRIAISTAKVADVEGSQSQSLTCVASDAVLPLSLEHLVQRYIWSVDGSDILFRLAEPLAFVAPGVAVLLQQLMKWLELYVKKTTTLPLSIISYFWII